MCGGVLPWNGTRDAGGRESSMHAMLSLFWEVQDTKFFFAKGSRRPIDGLMHDSVNEVRVWSFTLGFDAAAKLRRTL